jgi:hypothetical protein
MKRVPFVAVIGRARSGKTTVVRSLTGCSTGWPREGQFVVDRLNGRSIYVIDKSPQETGLEKKEFARALSRCARRGSLVGIVVTVQPTEPRSRLSMEDMFETVSRNKRFSAMPIVLDPGYDTSANPTLKNEVQKRLNQFGVSVVRLDGRRFSHLNARRIRRLAKMP